MKRLTGLILACAVGFAVVSVAAAQSRPEQVVRMGDWVEVGNEVFMNIIAQSRIHYQFTHNYDFENDIRDRTETRSNTDTTAHDGNGDLMFEESRLGVDMRYRKNLLMRVLFENQMTLDGNRIDNGFDVNGDPPQTQTFRDGNNLTCNSSGNCVQRNTVNLERAWIEYHFPDTPLTFDVGARIRTYDPAAMLGDDDPGIRFIAEFGAKKQLRFAASAIIQTESLRLGLQNDNDDVYYVFEGSYNTGPYQFGLSATYFRFRFQGASGRAFAGQKIDSVLLTPYISGTIGRVRALLQPMFVFGTADSSNATGNINYDIAAFGVVAALHLDLGIFRPYIGLFFGTGDDDFDDKDLNAFNPFPQSEITLVGGSSFFVPLTDSITIGDRDLPAPARAAGFGSSGQFLSTIFSPWHDRVGNTLHRGITTAYSNPGTLLIPVGVQMAPLPGHNINLYYVYRAVVESKALEAARANALGVDAASFNFSKSIWHELGLQYTWTLNSHFDFRLLGNIIIPAEGSKDIAKTVFACGDSGTEQCAGEDVALRLGLRFMARF